MPIRLSSSKKVALIRRYLLGEQISALSREANISRTIFYRWIYLYKDSNEYQLRSLFCSRLGRGKFHYRKISRAKELRIINMHRKYSDLSIRHLARLYGVSHTYVWSLLQKISQSESKVFRSSCRPTSTDKIMMIRRFEAGEKISVICRDFSVSRTIFYRWLKIYTLALPKDRTANIFNRRVVSSRYIPEVRKLAPEIVILFPRYSLRQIRSEMIKRIGKSAVSRHTINSVLREMNLDSKEKRINFSKFSEPTVTDI